MDFKAYYQQHRKNGVEAGFLQNAIAEHCGVTSHAVRKWLHINKVSKTITILMTSFNIKDFQDEIK